MAVLWFALGLYVLGIAVVLYLRPSLMFKDGNDSQSIWKEFGLGSSDRTLFPFWLFTIVWAISSYALATVLTTAFANLALRSTASIASTGSNNSIFSTASSFLPVSQAPPNLPPVPSPVSPPTTMPTPSSGVPGYYMLDSSSGTPKYIYLGTTPPHLSNLTTH